MSMANKISFRKVLDKDYDYLLELYNSTRTDVKLYGGHLTHDQKMAFIKSQFELQDAHYKKFNPEADFLIILQKGKPIGRLYTEELESSVSIIEMTIQTSERSKGIGSNIINDIIKSAHLKNKEVLICAAKDSQESKLYEKLGFKFCEDLGPYQKMTAKPKEDFLPIYN